MSKIESASNTPRNTLSVLSYNVQVGISTSRPRHYLTGSWKHVLPCPRRMTNLEGVARQIAHYDIVGLQEVDAGSIRSNFINMAEYLAERGSFPYWYHQVNRNLGRIAQHSNAFLSHYLPTEIIDLRLPGLIPGRQALLTRFESGGVTLAVIVLHLALSRRARLRQLDYISDIVNAHDHAIVMGDMNCVCNSIELRRLFIKTGLREPMEPMYTFPSWRPMYSIDHILVSSELEIIEASVIDHPMSDHLPIMTRISLPAGLELKRAEKGESLSFEGYMQHQHI
ncbi:MAG: endonuclease/exonuclease/phosphatase family protein [Proteobacteria bacterium]|jgi:endonuclease/exonuclease/phosphatase family metal-dependent hydrolase|nr:endonuclease/exonuclease/phosphatase family protein [Pseudomonadota bacterium]MCG6934633.1 endonuclease/exonuclease/phosphatase family protein [Pseudomonadota bacterium]